VNVLVSGGNRVVGTASTAWLWDPVTGNIQTEPKLPGMYLISRGLTYTDYESLVLTTNVDSIAINSFTVGGGWRTLTTIPVPLMDPVAMLVPKGLFHCI
jgi:hypothetical protein